MCSQPVLHRNIYHSFTPKSPKLSKCPSTGEWVNKLQYICPYSGMLLSNTKQQTTTTHNTNTKNSRSRERSQTQKRTYCVILLIRISRRDKAALAGSSVGQRIIPIRQGCGFNLRSEHIQESANECISKCSNKLVFSLKSIKKKGGKMNQQSSGL